MLFKINLSREKRMEELGGMNTVWSEDISVQVHKIEIYISFIQPTYWI